MAGQGNFLLDAVDNPYPCMVRAAPKGAIEGTLTRS
jgi:hypothetical protein